MPIVGAHVSVIVVNDDVLSNLLQAKAISPILVTLFDIVSDAI